VVVLHNFVSVVYVEVDKVNFKRIDLPLSQGRGRFLSYYCRHMIVEVVLQDTMIIGGGFGAKGCCSGYDLSKPSLNHAEQKIFVMGVEETKRKRVLQQSEDLLGRFKHNKNLVWLCGLLCTNLLKGMKEFVEV